MDAQSNDLYVEAGRLGRPRDPYEILENFVQTLPVELFASEDVDATTLRREMRDVLVRHDRFVPGRRSCNRRCRIGVELRPPGRGDQLPAVIESAMSVNT